MCVCVCLCMLLYHMGQQGEKIPWGWGGVLQVSTYEGGLGFKFTFQLHGGFNGLVY